MNKIINGKRYDTETAERVGVNSYSYSGQFEYWCEELYRKKTGEYFLYGEGGARSRYSVSLGNNCWGGGEKIIPLTDDAAKEWAEKNLNGDEYIEIFGDPDDTEEMQACFKITRAESDKLKAAARAANMTQLAFLKQWIETL